MSLPVLIYVTYHRLVELTRYGLGLYLLPSSLIWLVMSNFRRMAARSGLGSFLGSTGYTIGSFIREKSFQQCMPVYCISLEYWRDISDNARLVLRWWGFGNGEIKSALTENAMQCNDA